MCPTEPSAIWRVREIKMRWYCDQGVAPYGNAAFNPHSNS